MHWEARYRLKGSTAGCSAGGTYVVSFTAHSSRDAWRQAHKMAEGDRLVSLAQKPPTEAKGE